MRAVPFVPPLLDHGQEIPRGPRNGRPDQENGVRSTDLEKKISGSRSFGSGKLLGGTCVRNMVHQRNLDTQGQLLPRAVGFLGAEAIFGKSGQKQDGLHHLFRFRSCPKRWMTSCHQICIVLDESKRPKPCDLVNERSSDKRRGVRSRDFSELVLAPPTF
jgi:hypothetical protein